MVGLFRQEVAAFIGTAGDQSISLPKGLILPVERKDQFFNLPRVQSIHSSIHPDYGVERNRTTKGSKHMCSKSEDGDHRGLSV